MTNQINSTDGIPSMSPDLPQALWGHTGENWGSAPHTFKYTGPPGGGLVKMQILMGKAWDGARICCLTTWQVMRMLLNSEACLT